jgi:RNA-binding protein 25
VSGKLKGFGFCDYSSAEGVLRALRILNKLVLDDSELLVRKNF